MARKAFAASIDVSLEKDDFQGVYRGVCWRIFGLETTQDGSPLPLALSEDGSLGELHNPAASLIGATILKLKLFDILLSALSPTSTSPSVLTSVTAVVDSNPKLLKVRPHSLLRMNATLIRLSLWKNSKTGQRC